MWINQKENIFAHLKFEPTSYDVANQQFNSYSTVTPIRWSFEKKRRWEPVRLYMEIYRRVSLIEIS